MVGGVDYEGELAAARLRLSHPPATAAEADRRRREESEEGKEQFEGRLLALALAGVAYVLFALFG